MGRAGAIVIEPGQSFTVDKKGVIRDSDKEVLDSLRLETAHELVQVGGNLWEAKGATREATGVAVEQFALEGSNVNPLALMMDLIEASRYFEAFQKAMQTSDEMDQQLNNTGRG
jgi:flagellar basal-body rod protein FlgG